MASKDIRTIVSRATGREAHRIEATIGVSIAKLAERDEDDTTEGAPSDETPPDGAPADAAPEAS
jgi:hypothetical protein